jgi:hypothetical protein
MVRDIVTLLMDNTHSIFLSNLKKSFAFLLICPKLELEVKD